MHRLIAVSALALVAAVVPSRVPAASVSPSLYAGMRWRFVGPLRGGRTDTIAGVPDHPNRFYAGVVNGGVWRTDDAGRTWRPIFDAEPTGSVGALAVAPSDSRIVYVGSGEGLQRPDLAVGDGIYRSSDGGATWTHLGLRDAQQIATIAVDPHDPNRLFVAALGHPYGPNAQRGVFRSTDGGTTWQRVLYVNENVGAYDVAIDPRDPNTVYATLWAARQAPWEIGGSFEVAGSGAFKSTDGGTTWTKLASGLPARVGRTEVAIAPSDPNVVYVYADVESFGDDAGTVYRSDDAGAHFRKVNDAANIGERGDDLVAIAVAPSDPNTLYLTNTSTYRSTDGGTTFASIKGAPGGDDYHAVWLDPNDPNVIALGADQGATISVDDAQTWSSWYNQPTAEMYHVNADDDFPYHVCGGQQESGSACVSSRGNWGLVTQRDWFTAGAEEYGYVVPDPLHPDIYYGGKVEKFNRITGQTQEVSPIALPSKAYRAVRTEPLAFDRFDRRRLYFGSNVVFATDDGGQSWRPISPDLTRAHPAIPSVIAAFEADDPEHGAHRGVVYAIAPSYVHEGTIWAGTDDGLVWITRDGGAHWRNITPPALTAWSKIAQIDASRFDDDTAYVTVLRFRLDDLRPYLYVTHDGGAHWRLAVNGLPPDQPLNAVREDPKVRNLLYAAGENGVCVSFDDGAHWQSLQLNLPHTSVRDAIVHDSDLIVATHGRGFWILDDVQPLRALARGTALGRAYLFAPEPAYRMRRSTNTDTPLPPEEPSGQNPPDGAILDYALAAPAQRVTISIFDASGRLVRRYASDDPLPAPIPDLDKPAFWERPFRRPSSAAGMHRFVWDMHETAPRAFAQDLPISAVPYDTPRVPQGPLVPPGRYLVRLQADGVTVQRAVTVIEDPRVRVSQAALLAQYALARAVATAMDRSYADADAAREAGSTKAAAAFEGLNFGLSFLLDTVDGADAAPTRQALAALKIVDLRLGQAEDRLRRAKANRPTATP